jgi:hypothetical protein
MILWGAIACFIEAVSIAESKTQFFLERFSTDLSELILRTKGK